jgi:sugar phosphate isomerase/epimerase
MRLSVSSWSFHRELANTRNLKATERLDLAGFIRLLRERYAVEGLELWSGHLLRPQSEDYLADLAAIIADSGLDLANLACDAAKVGLEDPAARKQNLRALKRWIETAAGLGSRAIRINTAAAGDRPPEVTLRAVVADYRALAPIALSRGLTLLLENHGGLSSDPEMIPRIFKGVGRGRLRACPDNGNFPPELRDAGLRAMVPHMAMAHLKTLDFDASGNEPNFDIPAIVALYRQGGFDGFLSIEYEGKGDQYEGVEKSVRLARRALGAAP